MEASNSFRCLMSAAFSALKIGERSVATVNRENRFAVSSRQSGSVEQGVECDDDDDAVVVVERDSVDSVSIGSAKRVTTVPRRLFRRQKLIVAPSNTR